MHEEVQKKSLPELLAPAGTLEQFFAAIDAGANAVYCGVDRFNARLRAKNFTPELLARAISYAHNHNVKVYVTLNTLLKDRELSEMCIVLSQLRAAKPDALIVADPGLMRICRLHFPSLALHGSTQFFVHSLAGIDTAKKLGMSRVILARECTLPEIATMTKHSSMELEVFVHGALCYAFSGTCLASSFLGGSSGNRGCCTQVCRRPFRANKRVLHPFSLNDLCTLKEIPELVAAGVASLKIEGRMRSAGYVASVVSLYRQALDAPEHIEQLLAEKDTDLGRKKTSFFIGQSKQRGFVSAMATGTGMLLGKSSSTAKGTLLLPATTSVVRGDQLRIQPANGYEGTRVTVSSVVIKDDCLHIGLDTPTAVTSDDEIYLIRSTRADARLKHHSVNELPAAVVRPAVGINVQKILKRPLSVEPRSAPELILHYDSPGWLSIVKPQGVRQIVSFGMDVLEELFGSGAAQMLPRSTFVIGLPPFIPQADLSRWKALIATGMSLGFIHWYIPHPAQYCLLPEKCRIWIGAFAGMINSQSRAMLTDLGAHTVTAALEDDFINLRDSLHLNALVTVYGYIPLFISRVQPAARNGARLADSENAQFNVVLKEGLWYLLSQRPLCLFARKEKLASVGVVRHCIDLSFHTPDQKALDRILEHYRKNERLEEGVLFNFKLGLK